ncbi:MAG: thiamine pyrophosphate-dependent enzyme [Candidatus Eisenbacteria bacterium]
MKRQSQDYKSAIKPVWCAGCGDYAVLTAVQRSLADLDIPPESIVTVSGIGCSGRLSHYLNTYSLHGTHGRAVPTSVGVKAARPDLTVLAVGGDGDGLGIGGGHIPHAARKNADITYLLIDNRVYGLTKGQASPTTPPGETTKTSPYGVYEDALSAVPVFLAYDVSFVARANTADIAELQDIITRAIRHRGMSIVYILTMCRTFRLRGSLWDQATFTPLAPDHDRRGKLGALELAYSTDPIYTGVFYQVDKPTLEERLQADIRKAESDTGGRPTPVEDLLKSFV